MLVIIPKGEGLYEASVSPPDSERAWRTDAPLDFDDLHSALLKVGCHIRDVADAFIEADPITHSRYGLGEPK